MECHQADSIAGFTSILRRALPYGHFWPAHQTEAVVLYHQSTVSHLSDVGHRGGRLPAASGVRGEGQSTDHGAPLTVRVSAHPPRPDARVLGNIPHHK